MGYYYQFYKKLKIIEEYNEEFYNNNSEKMDEMDIFLETQELPKVNQEEIENLMRFITIKILNQ